MKNSAQSFWNGFGAIFGIETHSRLYEKYAAPMDGRSPQAKDAEALRSDWEQIGEDMRAAIAAVEEALNGEK